MRQLILSVVMFAFASLLFTPAAVASERLWATSTAPGGEESFTRLKNFYKSRGVATNRDVRAQALMETALEKAYENPNMPTLPTENEEEFKAALTFIFTEKNTLRVDSDGDVTWSNFMSIGSHNSGFEPLTAADIQRAIDLSAPTKKVQFVKQEVAEEVEETSGSMRITYVELVDALGRDDDWVSGVDLALFVHDEAGRRGLLPNGFSKPEGGAYFNYINGLFREIVNVNDQRWDVNGSVPWKRLEGGLMIPGKARFWSSLGR